MRRLREGLATRIPGGYLDAWSERGGLSLDLQTWWGAGCWGVGDGGAPAAAWTLLRCLLQRDRLRQRLCKGILLVRCCARRDALLAWGVLRGKQTLSRRDVPLSVFTKSSYIMHKSRER